MVVHFHIYKDSKRWQAPIHQLNSDVLLKNIRVKGDVGIGEISLSYCEHSKKGNITNHSGTTIGEFSLNS